MVKKFGRFILNLREDIKNLPQYHINLIIIIPFIFTGFSILAALLASTLTEYHMKNRLDFEHPVLWAIFIIGVLAFISGVILVRLILKPVEEFVDKARQLPPLSHSEYKKERPGSVDQIKQFTNVFTQVTNVLSRIDSKHIFPNIIGESLAIRGIMSLVMKVSPTDSTVLILGESGTGKELIASSIYEQSLRKHKSFIKLNCAAIPAELLESELFGHEKGSFTGATSFKPGKFDMAEGGTIFLDEIGDMPLNLQAKILRVIQEREFYRVGGGRTIKTDIRFIASTNKDLEQMVQDGKFREDLYYRLNVFTIYLPALRERKEDIPALVDHLLKNSEKKVEISSPALQILLPYSWPGNIRELQNVIERAIIICDDNLIEPSHLPSSIIKSFDHSDHIPLRSSNSPLDDRLNEMEKNLIMDALRQTGGVQIRATELLGINQRSLWHRIKKHKIDVKSIKNSGI